MSAVATSSVRLDFVLCLFVVGVTVLKLILFAVNS